MRLGILAFGFVLAFSLDLQAAEQTFSFSSPAFNGQGYSSHVLTIKQLEDQAKEKNRAAQEALRFQAERDSQNTPQARFIANLESRIYAQLAKQLTDSMFGEGSTCRTPGVVCGMIPDLGGNSVSWQLGDGADRGLIIITITSLVDSSNTTTIKVPSGTFYF